MKMYKELTYQEVTSLTAGSLAYISWDGRLRIPAFILPYPDKPDGLGFLYGKDAKDYSITCLPQPQEHYPISLAMTEYVPGGELVSPDNDDVPTERIVDKDGKPIVCRGEITETSGHTVTAGLVSRAWPNENTDPDTHKRVFHTGYKEEAK